MPRHKLADTPLSTLQMLYVKEYFKCGANAAAATRAMGLNRRTTQHWFEDHLPFIEYVEQQRKALAEETKYDQKKAMANLQTAKEFAKETGNANALVKALELEMKLHGMLIEKHDVRQFSSFSIKFVGGDPGQAKLAQPVVEALLPAGEEVDEPNINEEGYKPEPFVDEEKLWS